MLALKILWFLSALGQMVKVNVTNHKVFKAERMERKKPRPWTCWSATIYWENVAVFQQQCCQNIDGRKICQLIARLIGQLVTLWHQFMPIALTIGCMVTTVVSQMCSINHHCGDLAFQPDSRQIWILSMRSQRCDFHRSQSHYSIGQLVTLV